MNHFLYHCGIGAVIAVAFWALHALLVLRMVFNAAEGSFVQVSLPMRMKVTYRAGGGDGSASADPDRGPDEFVTSTYEDAVRFAAKLPWRTDDGARDAVHDAYAYFLRDWPKHSATPPSKLKNELFSKIKNTVIDQRRKQLTAAEYGERYRRLSEPLRDSEEGRDDDDFLRGIIDRYHSTLAAREQEILNLFIIDEFTMGEIADHMEMSPRRVRYQVQKMVEDIMARAMEEADGFTRDRLFTAKKERRRPRGRRTRQTRPNAEETK